MASQGFVPLGRGTTLGARSKRERKASRCATPDSLSRSSELRGDLVAEGVRVGGVCATLADLAHPKVGRLAEAGVGLESDNRPER